MNNKAKNIVGWVIAALLGFAFVMAGVSKLSGQAEMVQNFEKWGFPIAFMYFIGASEVLGAIGLFVKKTRFLAALCLIPIMVGGVVIHFQNNEPFFPPLVLTLLLVVFAWIRKPSAQS